MTLRIQRKLYFRFDRRSLSDLGVKGDGESFEIGWIHEIGDGWQEEEGRGREELRVVLVGEKAVADAVARRGWHGLDKLGNTEQNEEDMERGNGNGGEGAGDSCSVGEGGKGGGA